MIEDKLKKLAEALIDLGLQNDAEPKRIRNIPSAYKEHIRKTKQRKNIYSDLSQEEFAALLDVADQKMTYCAYCGKDLEISNSIQVDRVINKGDNNENLYSLSNPEARNNLVFCCATCNLMKGKLPVNIFLDKAQEIAKKAPHNIEKEKAWFQEIVDLRLNKKDLWLSDLAPSPRPQAKKSIKITEEEPHLKVIAASTDKLQSVVTYWENLVENLNEHYEKLKEQGATPALQQYWLHTALNAGLALRDIRWINDHPHADLNAAQGTLKHQLDSIKYRLPSLINNVFFAVLPPQLHHTWEDLKDTTNATAKDWFLHGFMPWKYKDPTHNSDLNEEDE